MKIIIVGIGKVGYAIAEQMTGENHDLVVIDRDSAVESLHYILGGAIEAVEFTATPATHFLDRPLSDLAFRKGLLVAAIVHEGKMQIPNGQSQIRAGDRVIVMAQELFLQDLNDILG